MTRRRIIPAYAGSTTETSSPYFLLMDHPRIRGEHYPVFDEAYRRQRIIPAYAGSTSAGHNRARPAADHPRIRGEHISCSRFVPAIMGSSPHTRGAQVQVSLLQRGARIIPAYAGSTSTSLPGPQPAQDHPRIRGEHRPVQPRPRGGAGSSPHTRGAPWPPTGSTS